VKILFLGEDLSAQQRQEAKSFLEGRNPEWGKFILHWEIEDTDYFDREVLETKLTESVTAVKWWKLMAKRVSQNCVSLDSQECAEFCMYIADLFQVPPSSAGIERMFSALGHIWTSKRNRLKPETAEKLCKSFKLLREKTKQVCKKN
jgi:hAT family C-terminal dimerisation region